MRELPSHLPDWMEGTYRSIPSYLDFTYPPIQRFRPFLHRSIRLPPIDHVPRVASLGSDSWRHEPPTKQFLSGGEVNRGAVITSKRPLQCLMGASATKLI